MTERGDAPPSNPGSSSIPPENGGGSSLRDRIRQRNVHYDAPGTTPDLTPPPIVTPTEIIPPSPIPQMTREERDAELRRRAAAAQAAESTPPPDNQRPGYGQRILNWLGGDDEIRNESTTGGGGGGNGGGNNRPPAPPINPGSPDNQPEPQPGNRRAEGISVNGETLTSHEQRAAEMTAHTKRGLEDRSREVLAEIERLGSENGQEREIYRVRDRLMELHNLSPDERAVEAVRAEMDTLYQQITEYTAQEKLEKKSAAVFQAEKGISTLLSRLSEAGRSGVYEVDAIEDRLITAQINHRIPRRDAEGRVTPLTEAEEAELQRQESELQIQLDTRRGEVSVIIGNPTFFATYSALKNELYSEIAKEEIHVRDQIRERVEYGRIPKVVVQEELTNPDIELSSEDTYSTLVRILNNQDNTQTPEQRDIALQKLEKLYQEARGLGILDRAETTLNNFYSQVRRSFGSDQLEGIIDRTSQTYMNDFASDKGWSRTIREAAKRGISAADLQRFRGIDVGFIASAFNQMQEMRVETNTSGQSQIPTAELGEIDITRGRFEWNLIEQERALREQRMNTERFYDYQVTLQLTGRNKDEIYAGVRNYIEHITVGSGSVDAQKILQSIELLGNAIDTYGYDYMNNEERIELRRSVENQLFFLMGRYFGFIGHTDSYIAVMDRWADKEGTQRMELVPQMMEGKVGYGIALLEDPEFALFWRQEGHRGQLTGNKDAQDYLGKLIRQKMIDQLAGKKIKGNTEEEGLRNIKKLSMVRNGPEAMALFEDITYENKNKQEQARKEADQALTIAMQYFDVLGETADLAGPSFAMKGLGSEGQARPINEGKPYATEIGDLIKIDEVGTVIKQAILLDAQKLRSQNYNLSQADALKQAVANAKEMAKKHWRKKDSEITNADKQTEYFKAVMALRKDGYTAKISGQKFQDIVDLDKHPELDYNPNNFIAIDHPLRNMIAHPSMRRLISKASQPFLFRAIQVLEATGIDLKMDKFQQNEMDNYVNAVEASRKLESDVTKIIYAEFSEMDGSGIDYGPANRPLAIKRLLHYRGYLMNNLSEKVGAAEYLIPWLPVLVRGFRKEIGAKSMFELGSSIDVGAFDIYEMQRWLKRVKSASGIKTLMEGGIDENFKRMFGLLEKPFSTITQLWGLGDKPAFDSAIYAKTREAAVGEFMKAIQSRIEPILAGIYALLDDNRGAAGAGGAKVETTEFLNEYFDWIMFNDIGLPREQGGRARYNSEVATFEPNTKETINENLFDHSVSFTEQAYNTKSKIRDEIGRRMNQGH